MAIDAKRARRALRAAGMRGSALWTLFWPLASQKRLLSLLRARSAVLEAKNNVLDLLLTTQRALSGLGLRRPEQLPGVLRDPEKKRLIMTAGASRVMLEEELSARHGSEVGRALDRALAELVAEGLILQVPAKEILASHDVYLVLHGRRRPHYDLGDLTQLLQEARHYGAELRSRARREQVTGQNRTYRM
ncbi:MAG: hypothetical protein GTO31_04395 [Xanthomonadales bacterium]|nr:hypothetical protein [Xanthomonadales bacterium]